MKIQRVLRCVLLIHIYFAASVQRAIDSIFLLQEMLQSVESVPEKKHNDIWQLFSEAQQSKSLSHYLFPFLSFAVWIINHMEVILFSDAVSSFRHYVLVQTTHSGHGGARKNEDGKQISVR